jgi:fibronectin type 3 domain-containing protein
MRKLAFLLFVVLALSCVGWSAEVKLTWNASTTAGVRYRVYRATKSGGPYHMIASGISILTYTDHSVVDGKTYFYVVNCRELDDNGISGYSNQAKAVIP